MELRINRVRINRSRPVHNTLCMEFLVTKITCTNILLLQVNLKRCKDHADIYKLYKYILFFVCLLFFFLVTGRAQFSVSRMIIFVKNVITKINVQRSLKLHIFT